MVFSTPSLLTFPRFVRPSHANKIPSIAILFALVIKGYVKSEE